MAPCRDALWNDGRVVSYMARRMVPGMIGGVFYIGYGPMRSFRFRRWQVAVAGLFLLLTILWLLAGGFFLFRFIAANHELADELAQARRQVLELQIANERVFSRFSKDSLHDGADGESTAVDSVPRENGFVSSESSSPSPTILESVGPEIAGEIRNINSPVVVRAVRYARWQGRLRVNFELHNEEQGTRQRGFLWIVARFTDANRPDHSSLATVTFPSSLPLSADGSQIANGKKGRSFSIANFSNNRVLVDLPTQTSACEQLVIGISDLSGKLLFKEDFARSSENSQVST